MAVQTLPGFAVTASVSSQPDVSDGGGSVIASFYTPVPSVTPQVPITIFYNVAGVSQIHIQGGSFDSGVLTEQSGSVQLLGGLLQTTTFTLHALDSGGSPILVNGNPLTATLKVVVI